MVNVSAGGPIGVFDSGLGGLTVAQEIWRQFPGEDVVYFGDTARVPYGGRSAGEIEQFNREIIGFLLALGVKLVVFACNTSSALAYPLMQQEYNVPMVEVITPGAQAAAAATRNGRIALLATEATVRSGAYVKAIQAILPKAQVTAVGCPRLVPLVEAGRAGSAEAREAVAEYLQPVREAGADTLVLGCTHYPYLAQHVEKALGSEVRLIDPAVETSRRVGEVLAERRLAKRGPRRGDRLFTSGDAALFRRLACELTGRALPPVEHVEFSSLDRLPGRRLAGG